MQLEDVIMFIINKPETWGGVALINGIGWYLSEKRNQRMAALFAEMMNKFADKILNEAQ